MGCSPSGPDGRLGVRPILLAAALAGCTAPGVPTPPGPGAHLPPYASRPFAPFSRADAVGIAEREWRAFGSLVNDDPPGAPLPATLRPDQQPGLWQRVADYWWSSQDFGAEAGGWSSRYDADGKEYDGQAPAWSAAFVSYVMRTAGAGGRFPYSPLHADYINAAARSGSGLRAGRPETDAPSPGDLICYGRQAARDLRFEDLPTTRFFGHCDLVASTTPGELSVIGGNVSGSVTMKHVPTTEDGRLADASGRVMDRRYPWFVILHVLYDQ